MCLLIEPCSEKYGKKLIGRTGIKRALKGFNKLIEEEARMAAAQNLKTMYAVDQRVRAFENTVLAIDNRLAAVDDRVADVNERVRGVGEQVLAVDDRVVSVDNRIEEVMVYGTQIVFSRA